MSKKNFKTDIYKIKQSNKTRDYISTENKKFSEKISKWVEDLQNQNKKTIAEIKDYFLKNDPQNINDKNNNIIATILNCKTDGKRIFFNNNLFLKRLHCYILGENLNSKCLTNDFLNLAVTYNKIVGNNEPIEVLLRNSFLMEAQITSENFKYEGEAYKGFIQDYDSRFSLICEQGYGKEKLIQLINEKPNEGTFYIEAQEYKYFGDLDACVIYPIELEEAEIVEKFENMKYIQTENNLLTNGQKTINYNANIYYVDKKVNGETFCPSFLIFDKEIKMNYFFDFEIDYNFLYEYIIGKNEMPMNLTYWDTLQYCFDFLTVVSLTAEDLDPATKKQYIDYAIKYYDLKPYISKWKDNQLLLDRIINDFFYSFLNNSEYLRFQHLSKRIKKYLAVLKRLKSDPSFTNIKAFFNSLPCATFIQNQLKEEVFNLIGDMDKVISAYLDGTRAATLPNEVRSLANKLQRLLPHGDMKESAFPMIIADGGITGKLVNYGDNRSDPLQIKINKNSRKIQRKKVEKKQAEEALLANIDDLDEQVDEYLKAYFDKKKNISKVKDDLDKDDFIDEVKRHMVKKKTFKKTIQTAAMKYNSKPINKNLSGNDELENIFLIYEDGVREALGLTSRKKIKKEAEKPKKVLRKKREREKEEEEEEEKDEEKAENNE